MKFFVFVQNLYPVWGGAEKSLDTLIKSLQSAGHEVKWSCESNTNPNHPRDYALAVWEGDEDKHPDKLAQWCDVIITQLNWIPKAVNLAEQYGKKSVIFMRSYENLCRIVFTDPKFHAECKQECTGCAHKITGYEIGGLSYRKASLIIANSNWTQHFLKKHHNLKSEVVYPFINFDDYNITEPRTQKYIAMNQLSYAKGGDIFLKIAQTLKQSKFKIVGNNGWMPSYDLPKNVELVGFQDPADIYKDVDIWLNPARWEEPFGRTPIEAQLAGVPVIASNYSTIRFDKPIIDGETGIVIKQLKNIREWVSAIKRIRRKRDSFITHNATEVLRRFSQENNTKKFIQLMREL